MNVKDRIRTKLAEWRLRMKLMKAKKTLGSDHQELANIMEDLSRVYEKQGRYAHTEAILRQKHAIERQIWGWYHPVPGSTLRFLAHVCERQGRISEAESLYREDLAHNLKRTGRDEGFNLVDIERVAEFYHFRFPSKRSQAKPLYQQALALVERVWTAKL